VRVYPYVSSLCLPYLSHLVLNLVDRLRHSVSFFRNVYWNRYSGFEGHQNGLADHRTPSTAMQLGSMLRREGAEGNGNHPLSWFELAGVSWSEFAAGTLRAQLGHFGVESGRLNFAETRVRSVPGEGL